MCCSNKIVLYSSTWTLFLSEFLLVTKWLKSCFLPGRKKKKINILYAEKLVIYESIFNYFSIFMSLQKNSENNLKNKNKRPQQCVTKGGKKSIYKA